MDGTRDDHVSEDKPRSETNMTNFVPMWTLDQKNNNMT
jgi:hypothetical protein